MASPVVTNRIATYGPNLGFTIKTQVVYNRIPQYIDGVGLAVKDGLGAAAQYTVSQAQAITPIKTGELSNPKILQGAYGQGDNTVYIRWEASSTWNGSPFRYGPIQDRGYFYRNGKKHDFLHYTTHGGPGFIDQAQKILEESALDFIERYMPGR